VCNSGWALAGHSALGERVIPQSRVSEWRHKLEAQIATDVVVVGGCWLWIVHSRPRGKIHQDIDPSERGPAGAQPQKKAKFTRA